MGWADKAVAKSAPVVEVNPFEGLETVDTEVVVPEVPKVWSAQQEAIFAYVVNDTGHLVVVARAGTGKTTTIVEAVRRYIDEHGEVPILVCAFNKRISEELVERFLGYSSVEVKTLHSIGYGIIRNWWGSIKVAKPAYKRADCLTSKVCDPRDPDSIKRLVTKLHTKGREVLPKATTGEELLPLAERFECIPDGYWETQGLGVDFVCKKAAEAMKLSESHDTAKETGIDFADMVGLPVRMGWTFPQYPLVVVDEAQDMSPAKHDLAIGVCAGRMIVVGDNRQAIYGFTGADSHALTTLKDRLDATELTLTKTYRCRKLIVQQAQKYVPDIEAESDEDGEVSVLLPEKLPDRVQPGDFVLSRLNAPIVSLAMRLLRQKIRTKVAGRDIGDGLKTLVATFSKGSNSVSEFGHRLAAWYEKQLERATRFKYKTRAEQVTDQFEMLRDLALGAKSVGDIVDRIDYLFTDDGLGDKGMVTCSTIHKAKGLEADRVFVLANTLRPGKNQEEDNLVYVAITRAKKELIWVR